MHWLALFVALWVQLSPALAQGTAVRGAIHRNSAAAPAFQVSPAELSGDASSGTDPWGN
jgi:hypothetical protein